MVHSRWASNTSTIFGTPPGLFCARPHANTSKPFWKPLPPLIPGSDPARLLLMGTLYYGDNLEILRRYLKDETVDLVYLDPPFNSAQNYNAFFQEKDGTAAASQIQAFEDT